MAKGDWAPGTKLEPLILEVTQDESGEIDHIGVGFHVIAASGRHVGKGGFTFYSKSQQISGDSQHVANLQKAFEAVIAAAALAEGIGN